MGKSKGEFEGCGGEMEGINDFGGKLEIFSKDSTLLRAGDG